MRKNEPNPTERVAAPIPFYDNDGQLFGSQTFEHAAGEVETFTLTLGWVEADNDAGELGAGSGNYYYPFSQDETNDDTIIGVRLMKVGYVTQYFWCPITVNSVDSLAQAVATLPSVASIRDAVLNALLENHTIVGSVADGIAIAAGLLQGNFFMDNTAHDANGQTSARMRIWRSAAAMGTPTPGAAGLEGAFAAFLVTTTYSGPNKIATHTVARTA